jgi:hypothetical protein
MARETKRVARVSYIYFIKRIYCIIAFKKNLNQNMVYRSKLEWICEVLFRVYMSWAQFKKKTDSNNGTRTH